MVDLIFLILTILIAYRLYSILGQKNQSTPSQGGETFAPSRPQAPRPVVVPTPSKKESTEQSFDPTHFLMGAEKAFETILASFLKGDKKALKPLLSTTLFKGFSEVIDQRMGENQTGELHFFRLIASRIQTTKETDKKITIAVDFESEQTQLIKDSAGEIIEGDPDHIDEIHERWTFEKKKNTTSPNWILIATEPL